MRDGAAAGRADHRGRVPGGAEGGSYVKYKQPASRFALIGVCVAQTAGGVRVGVTGAKGNAFRATEIENALAKSFTRRMPLRR